MKGSGSGLRLPLLACVVGLVVAFGGVGLLELIALITNVSYHGHFSSHHAVPGYATLGMWGMLVPVVGGLLIGLIARFGSPDVRGHGIPEAMQGVMMKQSRIPLRVAFLKPLASAISIGTGGPFGAEGPVIATGGAIGSLFGQWIPSSTVERKILLASGAAAGMTAAFGTPVAGVLLCIELLLFEFRSRSMIPVALAAGAAMAVRVCFGEAYPMLPLEVVNAPGPMLAGSSAMVGLISGLVAVGITHALHGIEHLFEKLPIHWMWWPALGGVAVGICGWLDVRTLGPGYANLESLLAGSPTLTAMATLFVFKFLSWSICLGSGTSGGTVAPVMTLGGAVGGMVALSLHIIPGLEQVPVGLLVLVGMVSVFAGVSRAFLTSVAFGLEATHATWAGGPLLLGCALAVLVSRICMHESMMTEKLARKGVRVPVDYEPDVLHGLHVGEVMLAEPKTVPPDMMVSALAERIVSTDPLWNAARLFPIVDDGKVLLGVVSRADILAAVNEVPQSTVLEAGVTEVITIHATASLSEAADRMILRSVGRLPVVDEEDPPRLRGLISRREILQARQHRLDAEKRI
ncbi:chloride channel protein [Luteolibacter yonseiensis]|uniref:Chloride channel protein n=1 Tax=Luteolibacter yonseiensis TaxID=1144680 RepID=A0A934R8C0_9BACT|nr:chloride channel protein [Luteolibacter yonseiensis]MBK1817320.1 chloride channel protein [Luteolibacter yonseiensis]